MDWGAKRTIRIIHALAILCVIEIALILPLVFLAENLMVFDIEPSIRALCKIAVYIDTLLFAVSMPTAIMLLGKYLQAKNNQR